MDIFNPPIRSKKARIGITAYLYNTGIVAIDGQKYSGYSMTEAIWLWRRENPIKNK